MDYPFHNLDPEKFQQFCQALLIKEHPNVQCFPVAQPDGGRDAVAYLGIDSDRSFIVYQIKLVKRPFALPDPHKWLVRILEEEAPKLKKQIPKGATQFVLITNVPGTAHPDSGSIDKANQLLSQLGVPSMCWWLDDLNRRLDSSWDLKWVYPELMTGPDLIRSVIESRLSENSERRSDTIRSFVKHQFCQEQEVKFRQVELQNRLLDLFIDVPISPPQRDTTGKKEIKLYRIYHDIASNLERDRNNQIHTTFSDVNLYSNIRGEEREIVGAATFLLHILVQKDIPLIVIEGAPGQGKSTITQYVCQVHRMRVLGNDEVLRSLSTDHKDETLEKLPPIHRYSPVRLPFKIDLRDLATWLDKKNPFSVDEEDELPSNWQKSLESFLAALVRHDSGGGEFDVIDLRAVMKLSPVLLVFDGLDEVADILKRQEVVNEIINGVNRLETIAESLQVVVTSRPAAFANSPGLPQDKFPHYQLDSLTRILIDEYTTNWIKARKLDNKEAAEIRKVIKEKLNQPHLRDLSKNPMQLTILLSLIRSQGLSLPEKRTALYDDYIKHFLDREAAKTPIVRDHRELLINVQRYFAWILHTEAEQGGNGSISKDKLYELLSKYLDDEGHSKSLLDELFRGMVERIMALVQRVEGMYEFEVQPLREYFTARYLYDTAPYSPTGNEKTGTLPDRFDAIARNFYWFNVTRFYAGCYTKGELPSLIDRLQDLIEQEGYRLISHPRILAATLLSDWVFKQHPKSVKAVVELILDGIGLRYVLPSNSRRLGLGNPLVLPKDCGQEELINHCFKSLEKIPPKDYALEIIDLIRINATQDEILALWKSFFCTQSIIQQGQWLEYGYYLGILNKISLDDLKNTLSGEFNLSKCVSLIFKIRRFDYCEMTEENFILTIQEILKRNIIIDNRRNIQITSIIELFCHSIDVSRYALAFKARNLNIQLCQFWEHDIHIVNRGRVFFHPLLAKKHIKPIVSCREVAKCLDILETVEQESQRSVQEWATDINPWNNIVEKCRLLWGDNWSFFHLANLGSGIKSKSETCKDYPELLDHSKSLCRRTRYARLQAGRPNWWEQQLVQVRDEMDAMFIILVLVTWASSLTLVTLANSINDYIGTLSSDNWQRLYDSVENAVTLTEDLGNRMIHYNVDLMSKNLDARTVTLLALRAKEQSKKKLYSSYLSTYDKSDPLVLKFCQELALDLLQENQTNWHPVLEVIAQSYAKGQISEGYASYGFVRRIARRTETNSLPTELAEEIAEHPNRYPGFLVAAAEAICKDIVASKTIPVGEIARRDKWFTI
ncbi:NTPase (NACHT family)-like protein [Fortiea sp. LEGE XX443]|uniref:NACHT domain-containing protein n=1 Tax=Fortiea sp. LEGE XX443 TaxID=1828611 RepID=UPI00187FC8AE|nr:NTPase (NACHT family)-like protein [Fortiea sp. LEGE XX443]MBE9005462.1 NTPase (NACHT family)-like protein [Fortiea sp. LEGE XX443]